MHKWNDIKKSRRTDEQLAKLRAEAAIEIVTFRLKELREALKVTQVEVASAAGMTQPQVSKMESSNDVLVSTLRRYASAVGGKLEISVTVGEQKIQLIQEQDLQQIMQEQSQEGRREA